MSYSEDILGLQNSDGGWGYSRGGSWTEPTCFALLGLAVSGKSSSEAALRGVRWLVRCQRSDGGFAPRESVSESVWLTALTLLLPASPSDAFDRRRALQWVLQQTGRESSWVNRLRLWMLGVKSQDNIAFSGWPWFPGTAAWVSPTAFSILALQRASGEKSDPAISDRIQQGQSFLLSRRCRDGGWNHGSTRALGYDSDSYPETTGLALLALHGVKAPEVEAGLRRAEEHLTNCRSLEAACWLRLGLSAHGRTSRSPELHMRSTTIALALSEIADAASRGQNLLIGN
jgi:hypothetical protein